MKKPTFDNDVPTPQANKGPHSKYWWLADMEVGQSFLTDLKTARAIHSSVFKKPKYLPRNFRVTIAQEGKQTRVWRAS